MLSLYILIGIILTILPINISHKPPQKSTRYQQYLRSHKWRKKRARRIEIDKGKCQHCGAKGNLQVHHKTYRRIYKERMKDLITLCKTCHSKEHARLNKINNK